MVKILHVDEHELCRIGLKNIVNDISASVKLHEASNILDALKLFKTNLYDVVVLETNIANANIYDFINKVFILNSNCRVLILSSISERLFALNYIKLGVKGFVGKYESASVIKEALIAVINDKRYFSDTVMDILLNHTFNKSQILGGDDQSTNTTHSSAKPFNNLSQRESEILRMILQGLSTKEIANTQNLRSNTVSTYKMRIFEKLNVANVFELVQLVKENGMFDASIKNSSIQIPDTESDFSTDLTIFS